MKKLLDTNRKAQLLTKLQFSLQKYDSFKGRSQLTSGQSLKLDLSNDQLTKELTKLLQINQKKKAQLKQQLIAGPIGIDLNQQMEDLRWRMDILKQNHRPSKSTRQYNSLTGKQSSSSNLHTKPEKFTFDELYKMQKQKFAALRERRKTKRLNLQYIQMIGNKQSRKQRSKQANQDRFSQQMRLLDEAIQGK